MQEADTNSGKSGGIAKLVGTIAGVAVVAVAGLYLWTGNASTAAAADTVVVYKTPTCGCCGAWVDHLVDAGLDVEVHDVDSTQSYRAEAGVPNRLGSCHTAVVGGYFVEGHVPADLIKGLIEKRPENIRGISVPGMPLGSPGMEAPNPVEYEILAVDTDGNVFVYATRQGSSDPHGH